MTTLPETSLQLESPTKNVVPLDDVAILSPSARSQYRSLSRWMAVTDMLAVLAGFSTACLVRFRTFPEPGLLAVTLIAPIVWLILLLAYRTYDISRLAGVEQFRRIVTTTTVGMTLVVTLSFWWKQPFSRLWFALAWVFVLGFLLIGRRIWDGWVDVRRREGGFEYATVIVGADRDAMDLGRMLAGGRHGFAPVGYVGERATSTADALSYLGSVSSLGSLLDRLAVECVFVSPAALSTDEMHDVVRVARQHDVDVRLTSNLPEIVSNRVSPTPIAGMTTLSVRPVRLSGPESALKRVLDITGAALGIVVLAPLFIAIAIAIKVSSRGPVLYRHVRVGRHGERFAMVKFRTMVKGADRLRDHLVELNEASGPLFKMRSDPRVTRVGKTLRKWSLDELPQLMNVLLGEMSLVGPRPCLPVEVERFDDWHRNRLEVRPGMTGLWQVSGRADLAFDDYVRLDLYYIENWSLAYDLFILLKTVPAVMSRRGSY